MPCYYPKDANIVLGNKGDRGPWASDRLNCGKCHGCKRERARQWTVRVRHELEMHEEASAITLTYSDEHLPEGNSLHYPDFQNFLKKLRRSASKPFSYFMCGEYGETGTKRPHFHAILLGLDFPDRYLWMRTDRSLQYRSDYLERVWTKGFSTVGDATRHSIAYVCGYFHKKIYGQFDQQAEYGCWVDADTGEIVQQERTPPFQKQSLNPALGKRFFDQYSRDIYPNDFVVMDGRKMRPPMYYDDLLKQKDPYLWLEVKEARYQERLKKPQETAKRIRQKGKAAKLKHEPFEKRDGIE